jgi:hypothetical protein
MLARVTTAGALAAACLCGTAFARPALSPPTLVATLNATNAAGANRIFGNVKLTPSGDGEYRVDLSIRNGGGAQNKYPWIIRSGQCGESASTEVGNPVAYRMLETTGDGTARNVNAKIKLEIPDGVHRVDVLKSPTEREVVVACGVLSPQQ